MQCECQAEMSNGALEGQGRLPKEGTPEPVLKEEQGRVKPAEGSLAGETGSDAGWPVTQKLVGGTGGELASGPDFIPAAPRFSGMA